MKNVVKVLVVVMFAAFAMQAQAQVKFGVKAGVNLNNIAQNFDDSDLESATKMRLAYHVGVVADLGLSEMFSIQPGVLFTSKGYSVDLEDDLPSGVEVDGYDRVSLNYVEIPVNAVVKISGLQIYAGPYVGIGIGGKNKWDYTVTTAAGDEDVSDDMKLKAFFGEVGEGDLDDDEGAYRALDYGVNFGLGYGVGPVVISAGYSLGLGNLTPEMDTGDMGDFDPADFKQSNRVITVSAAFFIGGN